MLSPSLSFVLLSLPYSHHYTYRNFHNYVARIQYSASFLSHEFLPSMAQSHDLNDRLPHWHYFTALCYYCSLYNWEYYHYLLSTAPGPVSGIELQGFNSTTLIISWKAPQTPNGLILNYNYIITVVRVTDGTEVFNVEGDSLVIVATDLGKSVWLVLLYIILNKTNLFSTRCRCSIQCYCCCKKFGRTWRSYIKYPILCGIQ